MLLYNYDLIVDKSRFGSYAGNNEVTDLVFANYVVIVEIVGDSG